MEILKINISEDARTRVRMMGRKDMTIFSKLMTSCWSPRPDIFVSLKKPGLPEDFNKFELDGLDIYIFKEAIFQGDSIQIELAKGGSDIANKDFDIKGIILEDQ